MSLHPHNHIVSTNSDILNKYRVYTTEEDVRKDVTSLYNKCGNDVTKMLEVIGVTLHETAGREDIKIYTDPNGSLISVTQAPQYGLQHNRQNAFLRSLDVIMDRTRKELETHKDRLNRELPYHYETQEEFKKGVHEAIINAPDQHKHMTPSTFVSQSRTTQHFSPYAFTATGASNVSELRGRPDEHKPRCFPRTAADDALEALPTSKYNGNYTLRR